MTSSVCGHDRRDTKICQATLTVIADEDVILRDVLIIGLANETRELTPLISL
jgi:hypothetical protein